MDTTMIVSRGTAAIGVLLCVFASRVSAQDITGHVRNTAGVGVPAVVVTMLDSSGATLMRALTDAQGRYRLLTNERMRQLRATRIGFRPRTLPIRPTGTAQTIAIVMESLPTILEAVSVIDQPGCPRRRDRAAALALWTQAQAALLATVVARQENSASLERLTFYRIVGEHRNNVLSQLVQRDSAMGSRPFGAARSAREFVQLGFHDATSGTFYAPDADVLLDDVFSRGYCFSIAARDRQRPTQVGLRFEPQARKRGRIDVDGTLWVDTLARALTALEYRYLGLPTYASTLKLGGEVAFQQMPPGFPAITDWAMRVAAPTSRQVVEQEMFGKAIRQELEAHELGGALARARWPDTTWTNVLGRVSGRVFRDTVPAAGVTIHLIGTPYVALTDSSGRYLMDALLPGRYTFATPDSVLNVAGFELTRGQSFVSDRDAQQQDVILPLVKDFFGSKCGRSKTDTTSLLIAARVLDAQGRLAANAQLSLFAASKARRAGDNVDRPLYLADTATATWERIHRDSTAQASMFYLAHDGALGSGGAVFICNAPPESLLRLDATDGEQSGRATFVTNIRGRRIYTPRIRMHQTP